jgi:LPS-assembly protein
MRFRFFPLSFLVFFIMFEAVSVQAAVQPRKRAGTVKKQVVKKDTGITTINADSVEAKQDQILEATGNAELRQDDQFVRADHVLFNQESNLLFADGDVRLEKGGTIMTGPSLKMDLNNSTGEMEQPRYFLEDTDLRGSADVMRIEGKEEFIFKGAAYTSCPAGNDDWLLKMSTLDLDRHTQIGTAYNARIEFMGVPILYTPWMNFPLNDRRRTGILAPTLGGTNKGGRELSVPIYLNIADNYDDTFTPRFIQKRGNLYDNEFRYMGNSYRGKFDYGELRQDKLTNTDRSHASLVHGQSFADGFSGSLNLNQASDDAYFRDLSPIPAIATQKNLLREGVVSYSAGWWASSIRSQSFQTLQDPAAPVALPYRRLHQVNVGGQRILAGATVSFNSEYVDFVHPTAINGKRTVLYPSISYHLLNDPAYYLVPKVGVHSTHYALGEYGMGAETKYDRTVPIFSLDSGLVLEREFALDRYDFIQTLEPRLFYVKVPYRDQDMLPNFDSAPSVFSFMQMFTENRFLGSDRIGDADQLTAALTSRLLDADNGNERLRFAIGQRFSRTAPRVILGTPVATTNQSDVLVSVGGRISKSLTLDSLAQYNPNDSRTEKIAATARYKPEAGKVFNLGYRYTFSADPDPKKTLRQLDMSTQWLLGGRWHMVAQTKYSLQEKRAVETLAGLEYNQDCWVLRLVAQEFITATNEKSLTYFIQLELNDLVRVGTDPLGALRQSIHGYSKVNELPLAAPSPGTP